MCRVQQALLGTAGVDEAQQESQGAYTSLVFAAHLGDEAPLQNECFAGCRVNGTEAEAIRNRKAKTLQLRSAFAVVN